LLQLQSLQEDKKLLPEKELPLIGKKRGRKAKFNESVIKK
jgi:hypothetical protein